MKNKVIFLISTINAILVTSFLYLLDSDKAYPNFFDNVIEFAVISGVLFVVFTLLLFAVKKIYKIAS